MKLREIFPDSKIYPDADVTQTTFIESVSGDSLFTVKYSNDWNRQLGVSCVIPKGLIVVAAEIPELNPCSEILSNGKASICVMGMPEDVIVVVDEWPVLYEYSIPCIHPSCRGPAVLYQNHGLTWQCACSGCHARTPLLGSLQRAFSHWCLIGFSENFYWTMPIVIAMEKPA